MKAPGTSARPISSASAASSTLPRAKPPASSGITTPRKPCAAISPQSFSSCAVSVSMMRRTSARWAFRGEEFSRVILQNLLGFAESELHLDLLNESRALPDETV